MATCSSVGWKKLVEGHPWFAGKGRFPIHAYSEYLPPPFLGRRPYTEMDVSLFSDDDPYGWLITEVEEEYGLHQGMANLAEQILSQLVELGQGKNAFKIAGHMGRNLVDNPYWPPELARNAGRLTHERYIIFLPLALSLTQDDKGRLRWTLFGSSEQGPERVFWKSFYSGPDTELPASEGYYFIIKLLAEIYNEKCQDASDLHEMGFRILPSEANPQFPYWHQESLPSWTQPFICDEDALTEGIRYLLTFRPFSRLPAAVQERYLTGKIVLLPFPGSLVFWGMPSYIKLHSEFRMAMQLPLLRLVARNAAPEGIKVPQSGWFFESGKNYKSSAVQQKLLLNSYKRTSRWDRARRYENELVLSTIEETIPRSLFGIQLDTMGLYGKPMAKNCQLWTEDSRLLLDGPRASPEQIEKAAQVVAAGGSFRYRFHFPAMRVATYVVYWQRPLIAYWSDSYSNAKLMPNSICGYMTAYVTEKPDLSCPVELWPRIAQREPYLMALHNFEHLKEHYHHQTSKNIIRFLDTWRRWGERPISRSFIRQVLRLPERQTLEAWLAALPEKAANHDEGVKLLQILESCLKPVTATGHHTFLPGVPPIDIANPPITYSYTATRAFEEAWWKDIYRLSGSDFVNTDNADCVQDPITLSQIKHPERDLEVLGDHIRNRYQQAIKDAGMEGRAMVGELPFHWKTEFDLSVFGGWKNNQEGHTFERDIFLIIPGKNRNEAVIMADHYDTAYMEDIYEKSRGGSGARISAAGADDNYSATATLFQAAGIFLKLAREGRLERDVWLVNLTGEEFPADCMGARHLAQALVERDFQLRLTDEKYLDLSKVSITGVYVLDMIGHNRESELDEFQISPGKGRASLRLAWQAHIANALWNMEVKKWNQSPERYHCGRGQRSADGAQIPPMAKFIQLQGQIRLHEDPRSSLFNTDGQIFSDCGIPVVLFMENYDISRSGYHDTKDTMENIDLDYGAAVAAISIETVARVACLPWD
jgi:hypothetical protein